MVARLMFSAICRQMVVAGLFFMPIMATQIPSLKNHTLRCETLSKLNPLILFQNMMIQISRDSWIIITLLHQEAQKCSFVIVPAMEKNGLNFLLVPLELLIGLCDLLF